MPKQFENAAKAVGAAPACQRSSKSFSSTALTAPVTVRASDSSKSPAARQWPVMDEEKKEESRTFFEWRPSQDAPCVPVGKDHHGRTPVSLGYCQPVYSHPPAISWRGWTPRKQRHVGAGTVRGSASISTQPMGIPPCSDCLCRNTGVRT